jgi:hypothetical protein
MVVRKPFQGARPDEFAGGKTMQVGKVTFGPKKIAVDMQGYVDRLAQQDDLIRRQHAALKQILTYAQSINEIGPALGKSARAHINLMVRTIISTARIAT